MFGDLFKTVGKGIGEIIKAPIDIVEGLFDELED